MGHGDMVRSAPPRIDAFVPRGSALDRHAGANTTSLYAGIATFPMLPDADLVRQLVHVSGPLEGVVTGEALPYLVDRVDHPAGELSVAERVGHVRRDVLPERRTDFLVNSGVPDHGELLLLRREKDENSVPERRLRHPKALEGPLGDEPDVAAVAVRLDVDADLARAGALRRLNRLDDGVPIDGFEKVALIHCRSQIAECRLGSLQGS